MRFKLIAVALAAVSLPGIVCGAPLYSENFDVDPTAAWTVNDPGLSDILADFHYDYSAIGVPPAPGGATTRGLKMTANNSNGVFSGFSVSPTGKIFSDNYRVEFDMWQNYVGPLGAGGSGSTQLTLYGIGTAGNVPIWAGSVPKESLAFGTTLDGGSAADFRAYSSAAPTSYPDGDPVYVAATRNGSDPYYSAAFAGVSAPAAQVVLFPGQTGTTDAGETSFAWRKVVIDVSGGFAAWSIDGVPLGKVDLSTVTLGGGNIFFGHGDTNASSSTDPNDSLLNVTIIDNVVVIPESASAEFLVEKDFTDGNPGSVEVTISCNTGLPLEQSKVITEGSGVTFVVTEFDSGELDCDITEEPLPGYTTTYDDGSPAGDECSFADVVHGVELGCLISNGPLPVEVEVTKQWFDEQLGEVIPEADAFYECFGEVFEPVSGGLHFEGVEDTESFQVFPHWNGGTTCTIEERVNDSSVESDDSDCQQLSVTLGQGASCTITNTRFFEGIPALNPFGLAGLALLLLWSGWIAFRRYG
jgi:hypothetical protein